MFVLGIIPGTTWACFHDDGTFASNNERLMISVTTGGYQNHVACVALEIRRMNMAAIDLVDEAMLEDQISSCTISTCTSSNLMAQRFISVSTNLFFQVSPTFLGKICHVTLDYKIPDTLNHIDKDSVAKISAISSFNIASATKSPLASISICRISNNTHAYWCKIVRR